MKRIIFELSEIAVWCFLITTGIFYVSGATAITQENFIYNVLFLLVCLLSYVYLKQKLFEKLSK